MMPWDHLIIGYICFSLVVHAVYREPPTTAETLTVLVASLVPDLIDKPLAWGLGVWNSGSALGHSLLFVVPVSVVALWIARNRDEIRYGVAFTTGMLSHLAFDVIPQSILGEQSRFDRVLWPFRDTGSPYETGFVDEIGINVVGYLRWVGSQVLSGSFHPYLVVVAVLMVAGMALWIYDGMPVGRELYRGVQRAVHFTVRSG